MKKKILFINPPWYRLQGLVSTHPPMGCLYIAGLLEVHGYDCKVWNADYSDKAEGVSEGSSAIKSRDMGKKYDNYIKALNDLQNDIWQEVKKVIHDQNPDVLGVAMYTASLGSAKNILKIAKSFNKEIITICGGPHASVMPEELIKDENVDFVVRGEGEHVTLNILEHLNEFEVLKNIKGICFKDKMKIYCTEQSTDFEDLNTLPLPAKHLLLFKEKLPSVVFQPIFTTRGCPHKCIYCSSHRIHGYGTRRVKVDTTIDEIKSLKRDFNVHNFFICDDTFGQNKKHAVELMNRLIDEELNITWGCLTRGEKITEEFATLMKKAGCTQISIGVETGSPRIRKLIKKGNTVEDVLLAAQILRKKKIAIAAFFMFGFPGENAEDIRMTLELLEKIQPYIAHCNIATADPGTEMLAMFKNQGRFRGDIEWSSFYHQNPELFLVTDLDEKESQKMISKIQTIFDQYNKRMQRKDIINRFPLYLKMLIKQKLYKHPRYLINKIKDLI